MDNLNLHSRVTPEIQVLKPSSHDIIDYIPLLQTVSFFVHFGMMIRDVCQLKCGKELTPERIQELKKSRNRHAFRLITIVPVISGIFLGIFDYVNFKKSKWEALDEYLNKSAQTGKNPSFSSPTSINQSYSRSSENCEICCETCNHSGSDESNHHLEVKLHYFDENDPNSKGRRIPYKAKD